MTSGVVTFDYAAWAARFPEFSSTVTEPAAQGCFELACALLNNTATSPVQNLNLRRQLLWLLVAHIAQLFYGSSLQAKSALVGRIDKAAEGSVNVSAVMPMGLGNAAYYQQTQYGLLYWTTTAPYRAFQYRPGPYTPVVPVAPLWAW